MAYPTTLDSYTAVAGTTYVSDADHANMHNVVGSAMVNVETVLGTNSGTSVLKNFVAGNFPARINASNVLQQPISGTVSATLGTLNNIVVGTSAITGGTANSLTLGTPVINSWDGWQLAATSGAVSGVDGTVYTGTALLTGDFTSFISRGMKLKFTQGGTAMQGFISGTPSVASGTTTLTIYHGTGYTMGTSALSNISYSEERAPYGFNLNPSFWHIEVLNTTTTNQGTPTNTTWYNVSSLGTTIPIGVWNTEFAGAVYGFDSGGVSLMQVYATVGTANNAENDKEFTAYAANRSSIGTAVSEVAGPFYKRKVLDLTAKSQRFINVKSEASSIDDVGLNGGNVATVLRVTPVWI